MTAPGDVLCDRFLVQRALGRPGAVGEAYEVRDQKTHLTFALKLALDFTNNTRAEFVEQFQKLSAIRAKGLARVFGYFEHDGGNGYFKPALLLELIDGIALKEWLHEKRPSLRERATVLRHVSSALAALHAGGLTHGDIHTRNIIVTPTGAMLIDPGSSRFGSTRDDVKLSSDLASQEDDLRQLAQLFGDVLNSETHLFREITARLADARDIDAALVAAHLAAHLRYGSPLDIASGSPSVSHHRRRKAAQELYKQIRRARQLELDRFCRDLSARASEWTVRVSGPDFEMSGGLDLEVASESEDTGYFVSRTFTVTDAANKWHVSIRGSNRFNKPWPKVEEGFVGQGLSNLEHGGRHVATENLELRWEEGAVVLSSSRAPKFPCNLVWIERCMRLLVGDTVPILGEGEGVLIRSSPVVLTKDPTMYLTESLRAELEQMRVGPHSDRFRQGLETRNVGDRELLKTPVLNACQKLPEYLLGLYSIDAAVTSIPSSRLELIFLVLLADGIPRQFRFEVELRWTPSVGPL